MNEKEINEKLEDFKSQLNLLAMIFDTRRKMRREIYNEKTGFVLNYRLPQDQVWKYEAKTNQISAQEVMGQSYESSTDIALNYSVKGVGLDEEQNITSQVVMDSMSMVIKSMQGELKPDISAILGKNFGLTFSPKGKKVSFSDPDSIKVDFGAAAGQRA